MNSITLYFFLFHLHFPFAFAFPFPSQWQLQSSISLSISICILHLRFPLIEDVRRVQEVNPCNTAGVHRLGASMYVLMARGCKRKGKAHL
jgi:hypothetical protein